MRQAEDMQRKADIGEMPREVLENYAQFRRQAMLGALVASIPALRDRLLADERFFFKINAEVLPFSLFPPPLLILVVLLSMIALLSK